MLELILYFVALTATIIDWLQSLTISRNPDRWTEINIILGTHPTKAKVNIYFSICIVVLSAAAYSIPLCPFFTEYSQLLLLGGWAFMEVFCVLKNLTKDITP